MTIQLNCNKAAVFYASCMTFGQRIKTQRKLLDWSGTQLGELLDPPMSKQAIAHWEGGRYEPQVSHVIQLCKVLNVSADYLVLGSVASVSARALRIASQYDALDVDQKSQWDLILMGMPVPPEIAGVTPKLEAGALDKNQTANPDISLVASGPGRRKVTQVTITTRQNRATNNDTEKVRRLQKPRND